MITNDNLNIKNYLQRKFNSNNIPEVEALAQIIGLDTENNIARMQSEAEPEPEFDLFALIQDMLVAGGGIAITPGESQLTISAKSIYDGGNANSEYFEEYAIDGGGA